METCSPDSHFHSSLSPSGSIKPTIKVLFTFLKLKNLRSLVVLMEPFLLSLRIASLHLLPVSTLSLISSLLNVNHILKKANCSNISYCCSLGLPFSLYKLLKTFLNFKVCRQIALPSYLYLYFWFGFCMRLYWRLIAHHHHCLILICCTPSGYSLWYRYLMIYAVDWGWKTLLQSRIAGIR